MKTLVLSAETIARHLTVRMAVDTVDYVYQQQGADAVEMPPKVHLDMIRSESDEAWCNAMPAYMRERNVGGIKWAGGFGSNVARGLPYIMGTVLLTDPRNGQTLAVLDARQISAYRTGAAAAVFAKYLAVQPLQTATIVGVGEQGQNAACCLHELFPDCELRLCDRDARKVDAFTQTLPDAMQRRVSFFDDVEKASKGAQLIVLLTTARSPILRDEWIEPGATVLSMGTYQQIFDAFTLSADKVVADFWAQAVGRGDVKPLYDRGLLTDDSCHGEISEVVAGKVAGRESAHERILGVSVGIGAHDICLAYEVYKKAMETNDGEWVSLQG